MMVLDGMKTLVHCLFYQVSILNGSLDMLKNFTGEQVSLMAFILLQVRQFVLLAFVV